MIGPKMRNWFNLQKLIMVLVEMMVTMESIYPCDLDEYDREAEKSFILEGFVEIYYWDGDVKEIQIKVKEYLLLLKNYLEEKEEYELAKRISKLKNQLI
ncbi:hypothetical protein ACLHDG_05030 [Sulfurovum sp. CS9]|uniref:hypothetical protein n=1 Tax=Sulfurovum sp. CS9 TaxID=3391146 RepID=UPI0039E88DBA